jgi:NAD(P)-dependent dehydrogenase (short-subunit alcohol dehydrogenase family)
MKKVVLVTGASSGIGQAVAAYLSKQAYIVYGGSRSATPHTDFYAIKLDVTSDDSVISVVSEIIEKEGRIDVLVNNAGIGSAGAVEKTPVEDIKKSFDVNFFGVVRMIQAVLPHMRNQEFGRIINMSTLGSMIGLPFRAFYSSSKGAMDLMTESLRLETERYGIKSCTIHPGEVRTNIAEHRVISTKADDETYGKTISKAFESLNASVEHGKDPALFGPLVEKIILSKRVRRNYYVGSLSELIGINLKKFLPYYMYEAILRKYFAADE